MAGKVVYVSGKKGGVAKTTLSINIAAAFKIDGEKVIVIDQDIDNDSTLLWANGNNAKYFPVTHTSEQGLKTLVNALKEDYDYIIIDGAPTSDSLASEAIKVADFVGICTGACNMDVQRNSAIAEQVIRLDEHFDTETYLNTYWILTKVIHGTNIIQDTVNEINTNQITQILDAGTSATVAYSYAYNAYETVFTYKNRNCQSGVNKAQKEIAALKEEIKRIVHEH